MKTPYDIDEAKRWFERAEKQARAAIKQVAAGDESALPKARRERDKMGELLRWFYYDDRPYYDSANERSGAVSAAIVEAIELGRAARSSERDRELQRLRREEQDRDATIDPATRQYRRELGKLREVRPSGDGESHTEGLYNHRDGTIEMSGWPGHWFATVRWRHQEKDFEGRSFDETLQAAKDWIDSAPEWKRDFHGRPVFKEGHLVVPHSIREAERVNIFKKRPRENFRHVAPNANVVSDFSTLDDLVAHVRQEGATHVLHIDDEIHLYFKRRDGRYEKSEVWQKDGYWHTQGPGSRAVVGRPPNNAKPIAVVREVPTRASETRSAHNPPHRRRPR